MSEPWDLCDWLHTIIPLRQIIMVQIVKWACHDYAIYEWYKSVVPSHLGDELERTIHFMLAEWKDFNDDAIRDWFRLQEIVWTINGKVDKRRSFLKKAPYMLDRDRFRMACRLGLEDHIREMNDRITIRFIHQQKCKREHLILEYFWLTVCCGQTFHYDYKYLAAKAMMLSFDEFVWYLWDHIIEYEQQDLIDQAASFKASCHISSTMIAFIMYEMDQDQCKRFLKPPSGYSVLYSIYFHSPDITFFAKILRFLYYNKYVHEGTITGMVAYFVENCAQGIPHFVRRSALIWDLTNLVFIQLGINFDNNREVHSELFKHLLTVLYHFEVISRSKRDFMRILKCNAMRMFMRNYVPEHVRRHYNHLLRGYNIESFRLLTTTLATYAVNKIVLPKKPGDPFIQPPEEKYTYLYDDYLPHCEIHHPNPY